MSGYQGANPLNPYAGASPWGAYGSNMLTPWANNWGWNYNPGAVSDWSAAAGSSPQWLGYQTLQQFMPQQQWQPQGQSQGQQQQPGGYPAQSQNGAQQPPQGQQSQQPQGPSPDQQLQMAMYWAGIGRPNYGGAGPAAIKERPGRAIERRKTQRDQEYPPASPWPRPALPPEAAARATRVSRPGRSTVRPSRPAMGRLPVSHTAQPRERSKIR